VRIRIVIQARVGSSRLPGKILMPLAGRPLLAHVVERLSAAREHLGTPPEIMVATTRNAADDRTAELCRELRVACFRGPRDDVLARYVAAAADLADDDVLVRATADNPLYCPRRAALIIRQHVAQASDYTCVQGLSYVVPEVMRVGALRTMAGLVAHAADADDCREHVTPYFRRPGTPYRVQQLPEDWHGLRPGVRLTVDTSAEYERMAALLAATGLGGILMSLEDAYQRWDAWQQRPHEHQRLALPRGA
jgi:spore coat polysaccharide biosynthesis protein SpsF